MTITNNNINTTNGCNNNNNYDHNNKKGCKSINKAALCDDLSLLTSAGHFNELMHLPPPIAAPLAAMVYLTKSAGEQNLSRITHLAACTYYYQLVHAGVLVSHSARSTHNRTTSTATANTAYGLTPLTNITTTTSNNSNNNNNNYNIKSMSNLTDNVVDV